jgi:hypothetical protein
MQTYGRGAQQPHGGCTIEPLNSAIQPLQPKAVRPIERIPPPTVNLPQRKAQRSAAQQRVPLVWLRALTTVSRATVPALRIGASARRLQRMQPTLRELRQPHGKARLCVRTRREGGGFRV